LIDVLDPDQVFAGNKTICASVSGNFEGCPRGAEQLQTGTAFDALEAKLGASRRVLLRRGEQWSGGGGWTVPASAQTVILGAYGTGAPPRVSHVTEHLFEVRGSDFRVMDLHLASIGEPGKGLGPGEARDLLALRLRMEGYRFAFFGGGTRFSAVDNRIGPMRGGRGGNGSYIEGEYLALQGNVFEDASQVEHTFRSPLLVRSVLSHNDFGPPARSKHVLKIHAPPRGEPGPTHSERIIVSDNVLRGGQSAWLAVFGPQHDAADERVRDVIFERNHVIAGPGGNVGVLLYGTHGATLRNNVVDMSAAESARCFFVGQRGVEPPAQDVSVYNNTCYSRGEAPELVKIQKTASNVRAFNNLTASRGAGTPVAVIDEGAAGVVDKGNLATTQRVFVQDTPAKLADFALRRGSVAIDKAVLPAGAALDPTGLAGAVDGDRDGTPRRDLGAFEYVTP
jgi:hypothetical protein